MERGVIREAEGRREYARNNGARNADPDAEEHAGAGAYGRSDQRDSDAYRSAFDGVQRGPDGSDRPVDRFFVKLFTFLNIEDRKSVV